MPPPGVCPTSGRGTPHSSRVAVHIHLSCSRLKAMTDQCCIGLGKRKREQQLQQKITVLSEAGEALQAALYAAGCVWSLHDCCSK